jgi:hypothetical protein
MAMMPAPSCASRTGDEGDLALNTSWHGFLFPLIHNDSGLITCADQAPAWTAVRMPW